METKVKVIAFYLPQYHPTIDNDKWWGKGFTEWTNVGRARPLFPGHYQPKVPADLGYYDLRLSETREAQAELAKEAGVSGFCYYHYWFGYGKQELERPFNEVLSSGKPDFPFCLCWANESWHCKFWNMDGTVDKNLLIEQRYGDEKEWKQHFNYVLKSFKDPRYIRIDNKPLFMIYRWSDFPQVTEFIQCWQKLAQQNGLDGIYFISQNKGEITLRELNDVMNKGFDGFNTVGLLPAREKNRTFFKRLCQTALMRIFHIPRCFSYKNISKDFISTLDSKNNVFPTLIPNWDHTPRSGYAGVVVTGSTPELFAKHIRQVLEIVQHKSGNRQIIFLKSWNEWGEGNYMEPDLKFGKGYIKALRNELDRFEANKSKLGDIKR